MYAGPVMNRCARIASFAPIGHILTTATVWQIAQQSCSTGRLCDASPQRSSTSGDDIWMINHGWYTFKGVRQSLEIVHIQDCELCTRPFPASLPRFQRVSSHTADGLRRSEMNYAMGSSAGHNEHYDSSMTHVHDSALDCQQTDSLEETRKLRDENEKLQSENEMVRNEVEKLQSEIEMLKQERNT